MYQGVGTCAALPEAIQTTMVSPTARMTPSMTAAKMPLTAAGSTYVDDRLRELEELVLGIPNPPLPEVPVGADEDENVEVKETPVYGIVAYARVKVVALSAKRFKDGVVSRS